MEYLSCPVVEKADSRDDVTRLNSDLIQRLNDHEDVPNMLLER